MIFRIRSMVYAREVLRVMAMTDALGIAIFDLSQYSERGPVPLVALRCENPVCGQAKIYYCVERDLACMICEHPLRTLARAQVMKDRSSEGRDNKES